MTAAFIKFSDHETCDRMRHYLWFEHGLHTYGMTTRPWAIVFVEGEAE